MSKSLKSLLEAKDDAVNEIRKARLETVRTCGGDAGKIATIDEWAELSEERACVLYDIGRMSALALDAKPAAKKYYQETVERLEKRRRELDSELPRLNKLMDRIAALTPKEKEDEGA